MQDLPSDRLHLCYSDAPFNLSMDHNHLYPTREMVLMELTALQLQEAVCSWAKSSVLTRQNNGLCGEKTMFPML